MGESSPSLVDLQNKKLHMHPTGEFINESSSMIKEINYFNDKFPTNEIGTPDQTLLIYNLLRSKLFALSATQSLYYND
jgi:hypothetical protein